MAVIISSVYLSKKIDAVPWQCDYCPLHCQCLQHCIGKAAFLATRDSSSSEVFRSPALNDDKPTNTAPRNWVFHHLVFGPLLSLLNSSLLWLCSGPHALYHASVQRVPNWPKGCMHYLRFILPKDFAILVVFISLQNRRLLYHRGVTVSLGFLWLGSKERAQKLNQSLGRSWKVFILDAPAKHKTTAFSTSYSTQSTYQYDRAHGNWHFLKEWLPQKERFLYSCIFSISFKLIFCNTVNKWKDQHEWALL